MRSITAMLASRPVIFISAVSKELRSTRDLVAKTLTALGYEPKWQDIAPTETGDLRTVLRKWVDGSHAVLQIVGHRYGFAPDQPDETFGQVSYTQYEALYAKAKGKKVWYIILDEDHPTDCPDDEPEDLKKLQSDYRIQVKAHHGLYHSSATLDRTENIVLKLRDDLAILREQSMESQKRQDDALTNIQQQNEDLLAAIRELPRAVTQAQQAGPYEDEAVRTASAYAIIEESLKLQPGILAKELPAFAEMLIRRADTSEIDRANALFAAKKFAEAEAAAIRAKDQALAAVSPSIKNAIAALSLAGQSASEQIQYKRALGYYHTASTLTSEERDVLQWAHIQNQIGWILYLDGQYDEQADLVYRVWQACEKAGYQEDLVAIHSHNHWANALHSQGKYTEAETEHRKVLAKMKRLLGPEHRETLASRCNLTNALYSQGKFAEAETELRAVMAIWEGSIDPEHSDILRCRNNLAGNLTSQGRYTEAEKECRAVLAIRIRQFGPEHPSTLTSRMNLASALSSQGKHSDAEKEQRAIIGIEERVLGSDHPDTLVTRMNFANSLDSQGKYVDAEKEHSAVLGIRERVLGSEHPDTLVSRMNRANSLYNQGKHAEAEKEHRAVLAIRERVLGPEHPDTLMVRMNLANALDSQGRSSESEKEYRLLQGKLERVFGPEHPGSLMNRANLAIALNAQGKHAETEQEYRAVIPIMERVFSPQHPIVLLAIYNLAGCLGILGKKAEALELARRALTGLTKVLGEEHPNTQFAKRRVEDLEKP